jgi:hypothetical protein
MLNMNHDNAETITVSAETVETEPSLSLQEKVSEHFDQAKAEGKTRVKRIREIFKVAFSEALSEVKGGSGQVWEISKGSIATVLEIKKPDVTEENTTVNVTDEATVSTDKETSANRDTDNSNQSATPAANPAELSFWQSVLHSAKAKAKSYLKQEYQQLPDRLSPLKEKISRWDGELGEKYGDRYTSTRKTTQKFAKQAFAKAADWYRQSREKDAPLKANPLERQQIEIEVVVMDAGEKVAEKENQIKQQLKDVLKSVISAR